MIADAWSTLTNPHAFRLDDDPPAPDDRLGLAAVPGLELVAAAAVADADPETAAAGEPPAAAAVVVVAVAAAGVAGAAPDVFDPLLHAVAVRVSGTKPNAMRAPIRMRTPESRTQTKRPGSCTKSALSNG